MATVVVQTGAGLVERLTFVTAPSATNHDPIRLPSLEEAHRGARRGAAKGSLRCAGLR